HEKSYISIRPSFGDRLQARVVDVRLPAFEIDGAPVSLASAVFSGVLSQTLNQALERLRAEVAMDEIRGENGASGQEKMLALQEWRSSNHLFSADATMAWLDRHALTHQQLMAYLGRRLLVQTIADEERAPVEEKSAAMKADRYLPLLPEEMAFDSYL